MIKKIFPFLLLLAALVSCHKKSKPDVDSEKRLSVLTTIAPYAFFVDHVSGQSIDTTILIPPGANIHTYESTPKQLEKLANVDLWIQIGSPIEKQIEKSLTNLNPQLRILNMGDKIPLINSDEGHIGHCCSTEGEGKDIHLWMGVKETPTQVRLITENLIAADSKHKDIYLKGMNELIHKIETLDRTLSIELRPLLNRTLLLSHPSLGYFCHDYGLKQLSVECEGKSPRPQDLDDLLKSIDKENPICVLTQAGFDNRGAELIAKRLQLPVYSIDPYAYDYLANMEALGHIIITAAEQSGGYEKSSH